jgi:hypothetical protein
LPAKGHHDKLVDRGRVGVFMGYLLTDKQMKVYVPDLGYTIRTSVVCVDEETIGGSVDLKLRIPSGPQGTPNTLLDRKRRGRPRLVDHIPEEQTENAHTENDSTMESNHLENDNHDNEYDVIVVKPPEKPQVKKIVHINKQKDKEHVQINIPELTENTAPLVDGSANREEVPNETNHTKKRYSRKSTTNTRLSYQVLKHNHQLRQSQLHKIRVYVEKMILKIDISLGKEKEIRMKMIRRKGIGKRSFEQ